MHAVPLHANDGFQLPGLQLRDVKHGAGFVHLTAHAMGKFLGQQLK
jgi:hypothetical protein